METPSEQPKKGGRKKRDDPTIKRRSTRACDQCRKTKSKCEFPLEGGPCKSCQALEIDCTLAGPSLRRGPPKGYLHAVETRLHEVEAILGILISIPDSRATSLLSELSKDPFARDILSRVNNSPFGPAGRPDINNDESENGKTNPGLVQAMKTDADPYVDGPTNAWQDGIIQKFISTDPQASTFRSFGTSEHLSGPPPVESALYPNRNQYLSHISDSDYLESDEDDTANAIGELSLDEHNQVRFHGKSSGLKLLGQSDRDDHVNVGGLWRLKDNHAESNINIHDSDIEMPPLRVQEYLLELFFTYTYASFPIIDRPQLWKEFQDTKFRQSSIESKSISKLLLLSMFAIAARHTNSGGQKSDWKAGYEHFDKAKSLLNRTYHISHPMTCQALLLLALREFGMGAVAQTWLYVGMAIRMAQDLGMHRTSDNWVREGKDLFTPLEKVVRKRIWYGCVKMDKYISMYMGRPVTIHEKDFDTLIPDDINDQEFDIWQPHSTHPHAGYYKPVPGRFISSCNANSALSIIVCRIIERLYAVRNDNTMPAHWTEAMQLKQQLDMWMQELPDHLKIHEPSDLLKVPPHILTLHMQYECAVILLYRRFIRVSKKNTQLEGPSLSAQSLENCLPAASRIHNYAHAYRTNFTLQHATPFDAYDMFYAGAIWVTALTVQPWSDEGFKQLENCIKWLKEMVVVWPCAARCHQLLCGAKVARPMKPLPAHAAQSTSAAHASNDNINAAFNINDLELDPSSYASQLLFADVSGGPVDSSLFNGYLWTNPPRDQYAEHLPFDFQTDGLFDFRMDDNPLITNGLLDPSFLQILPVDRSTTTSEDPSTNPPTPLHRTI